MSALLFGSISTIADTSELQRAAFNEAFAAHHLDWRWEREDYVDMLRRSGGADRVGEYAAARGQQVDAAAVHRTKSELFQQSLARGGLTPRAGVVETLRSAREQGLKVGLVTTTSPENVQAVVAALQPALGPEDFDVVVDAAAGTPSKPDGAAYALALRRLGEDAGRAVAVEDNVDGVRAAVAAGVACVAFPNQNTATHDFTGARAVVDRLDLTELAVPR